MAALAVLLTFVVGVRIHLFPVPLERDEGEFGYMGQLINQGVAPYVEAYNMKTPGTYAMYALFLRSFGDTAAAIRLGLLLTNAVTIVLVFLLARPIAGAWGAFAGATAFAAMSLSPTVLGTFAHATHFVVVFALAGLLCLGHALRTGRWWRFLLSGVLLGLSVLMKQNGVFFVALAVLQLAWVEWRRQPRAAARAAGRACLLALGVLVPLVAAALILVRAGAWPRFWFWVVSYAHAYVSQVSLREAPANLRTTGLPIVQAASVLGLLALGGLAVAGIESWRSRRPGFVLTFVVVSAAAVCPGFWFRPHYYILFLPAAALLVAVAARTVQDRLAPTLGAPVAMAMAVALAGLGAAQVLYTHRIILFDASPGESSRLTYPEQPFPEGPEIAAYLRARTQPGDRIAVIGSEPQIYFYAQRRAATGYLYTYPMMEPQPFARRMQDEMIREIEGAMPAYVVFVTSHGSWMAREDSDLAIVDWAKRFLAEGYQRVGVVEIPDDGGPGYYYWDEGLRDYRPRWSNRLVVMKRKPPL